MESLCVMVVQLCGAIAALGFTIAGTLRLAKRIVTTEVVSSSGECRPCVYGPDDVIGSTISDNGVVELEYKCKKCGSTVTKQA